MDDGRGWRRLRGETLHRGRVLRFVRDDVVQPDGRPSTYEYIRMPDGARVVLLDDAGRVALVEDDFYLHGRRMETLPGGGVDDGESPEDAAVRECAEETGVRPTRLRRLTVVHPLPSSTAAAVHVFLGTRPEPAPELRDAAEAGMTVRWVPLAEAVDAARRGDITEAGSVVGLLLSGLSGPTSSEPV